MTLANTPAYWPTPPGGWPGWLWTVRYDSARHPGTADVATVAEGANCQLYTYALLNLYGLSPRPHRSSELGRQVVLTPRGRRFRAPGRRLVHDREATWGAHVALRMGPNELLHLSASEGVPTVWSLERFAAERRYRHLIGMVRISAAVV